MQVHEISSRHAELELFSQISGYLANSERPIARFLARLPIPAIELESVRTELFGTPGLAIGTSAIEVAHLVPEYETFLQSVAPTTLREQPVVPALLVHDLVGHLILEQPTTPRGDSSPALASQGSLREAGADYYQRDPDVLTGVAAVRRCRHQADARSTLSSRLSARLRGSVLDTTGDNATSPRASRRLLISLCTIGIT